ncbi:MAG TPA: metal-dependent hydrolase [Desulfobacteria bacterium]|nr:metal-dependent hydrolase [Desulfobacteria bacterium]
MHKMDPLTHLLVGIGVTVFTGENFNVTNPVHIGTALGSLAPDFDIVLQLFGHLPYLKHHRGSSHSLPGIVFSSAVIALGLGLLFGGSTFGTIFLWTLLGSISHVLLDVLNSYGAKIFWPLSSKSYSLNLLVLADPVIIILFAAVSFLPGPPAVAGRNVFLAVLAYLGARMLMRQKIHWMLRRKYNKEEVQRIVVMPAMVSLINWSFLVETKEYYIIGEVPGFTLDPGIKKVLDKTPANSLIREALRTKVGLLFQNFTPYYHIYHRIEEGRHIVRFCDLRYFFREDFLHNATVIFDETQNIVEAVFQPYNKNTKIQVLG